jgi:CHAT domain-containing protein/Tfp pilus assembly protein PilF
MRVSGPSSLFALLAVCSLSVVAASAGPTVLTPGETVKARMPAGDPEQTRVQFEFVADEDGTFTLDVTSLEFDVTLRIFRIDETGAWSWFRYDDDSGTATNSRVTFDANAGQRFVAEVRSIVDDWGGPFELSVGRGPAQRIGWIEQRRRDLAYWDAVAEAGERSERKHLVARATQGRASVFLEEGDFERAHRLAAEAHALMSEALGRNHPSTIQARIQEGIALESMGDYAAARSRFEESLRALEETLGPDHPYVALAFVHLGGLVDDMDAAEGAPGGPLGACEYYRKALAILERSYGDEHPWTATALLGVARWSGFAEPKEEARPYLERALAIRERAFGPDHPLVAACLPRLAGRLRKAGEAENADRLEARAREIWRESLDPEHPDATSVIESIQGSVPRDDHLERVGPLYDEVLAAREAAYGPDHPLVATALMDVATFRFIRSKQPDREEIRRLFDRALEIRRAYFGEKHREVADALNRFAWFEMGRGEFERARPLFEQALAITSLRPSSAEHATTLWYLSIWHFRNNDVRKQHELWKERIAIKRALGHGVAYLERGHAWGLARAGYFEEANRMFAEVLRVFRMNYGPTYRLLHDPLEGLGWTHNYLGDFAEAKRYYDEAVALFRAHGETWMDRCYGNYGVLALLTGEWEEARDICEACIDYHEESSPDGIWVGNYSMALGHTLIMLGEYEEARPWLERAHGVWTKRPVSIYMNVPSLMAFTINGLGRVADELGDEEEAERRFREALEWESAHLNPEHPVVAETKELLADLLSRRGEHEEALNLLRQGLSLKREVLGADHPGVAIALEALGAALLRAGRTGEALETALEAESTARKHLRLVSRGLPERRALAYAGQRPQGQDLALTLVAAGHVSEAEMLHDVWDSVVRSRAVVLDEMSLRGRSGVRTQDPEIRALAERLEQSRARLASVFVRKPEQFDRQFFAELLAKARREREEAEYALAAASVEFAAELQRDRLGLDEVVAALPDRTALVAFTRYEHQVPEEALSYLAWVLEVPGGEPVAVPLGAAAGIDSLVSDWREQVARAGRDGDTYRAVGEALRQRIWDPLTKHLTDAETVFLVPDGSLHLVNYSALPSGESRYLIETAPPIHYVSAERDLVPHGALSRSNRGLLALGGADFDETALFAALAAQPAAETTPSSVASPPGSSSRRSACGRFRDLRFESLPATSLEVEQIAALWNARAGTDAERADAIVLAGESAEEAALKRLAPGRRILHVSTHGYFLGGECRSALDRSRGIGGLARRVQEETPQALPPEFENPFLLAGLALAGANHRRHAGPGEEDGILTAEEIASLDLSGVEWAVLSACDTGVGDVKAGEGVFGLRRAFQVAGAGTLIMSLWSVDDESTREWMTALYEARLKRGLSTAESVRHASSSVLEARRKAGQSTHPFHWAAFVAAGDWR